MGRRGPKKKPTALKVFEGNRGKRKLPKDEPAPPPLPTLPPPPKWIAGMEHAVAEWKAIGPVLMSRSLLSAVDLTQFAVYCRSVHEAIYLQGLIDAQDVRTDTTDKGNVVQHPYVGQLNRAIDFIGKFAAKFGLSPAERVGLSDPTAGTHAVKVRTRA